MDLIPSSAWLHSPIVRPVVVKRRHSPPVHRIAEARGIPVVAPENQNTGFLDVLRAGSQ